VTAALGSRAVADAEERPVAGAGSAFGSAVGWVGLGLAATLVFLHLLDGDVGLHRVSAPLVASAGRGGDDLFDDDVVELDAARAQVAVEHDPTPARRVLRVAWREILGLRVPRVPGALKILLRAITLAAL